MVNLAMVNAKPPCRECADFCIIFAVSGRFLHFKNPFKYTGRFKINHKSAHPPASASAGRAQKRPQYQRTNGR
jgi:hypothetical protein